MGRPASAAPATGNPAIHQAEVRRGRQGGEGGEKETERGGEREEGREATGNPAIHQAEVRREGRREGEGGCYFKTKARFSVHTVRAVVRALKARFGQVQDSPKAPKERCLCVRGLSRLHGVTCGNVAQHDLDHREYETLQTMRSVSTRLCGPVRGPVKRLLSRCGA